MNTDRIEKIVAEVNLADPASVKVAASRLMESEMSLSSGAKVAVIDDPTNAQAGCRGTVKGPSSKGTGWYDIELESGTVMPMQADLLIPL